MHAIVGASGAGKSTIISMIPRLYDVTAGSVNIAGTDIRKFDLDYLRKNMGIVTQDTNLFNGTVLENLLLAKPDATTEEIEKAAEPPISTILWIIYRINLIPLSATEVLSFRAVKSKEFRLPV